MRRHQKSRSLDEKVSMMNFMQRFWKKNVRIEEPSPPEPRRADEDMRRQASNASNTSKFSFEYPYRQNSFKYYKPESPVVDPPKSFASDSDLSDYDDDLNVWDDHEDLAHLEQDDAYYDALVDEVNEVNPEDLHHNALFRSQSERLEGPERPQVARMQSLRIQKNEHTVITLFSPTSTPGGTPTRTQSMALTTISEK